MVLVSPHGRRPKRLVGQLVISSGQLRQKGTEARVCLEGPWTERRAAASQVCTRTATAALRGPVPLQAVTPRQEALRQAVRRRVVVVAEELSAADPAEEDRVAAVAEAVVVAVAAVAVAVGAAVAEGEGEEAD